MISVLGQNDLSVCLIQFFGYGPDIGDGMVGTLDHPVFDDHIEEDIEK